MDAENLDQNGQTPDAGTGPANADVPASGASPTTPAQDGAGASTGATPPEDKPAGDAAAGDAAAAAASDGDDSVAAIFAEFEALTAQTADASSTPAADAAGAPPATTETAAATTQPADQSQSGFADIAKVVDSWTERREKVVANWTADDGTPRQGMEGEKLMVAQLDEFAAAFKGLAVVQQQFTAMQAEAEEQRLISEGGRLYSEIDAAVETLKGLYPNAPIDRMKLGKLIENGGLQAYASLNRRAVDDYFGKLGRDDIVEIFDMAFGRRIKSAAATTARTDGKKQAHRELSGASAPALSTEPASDEERIWRNYQEGAAKTN